MIDKVKIDPKVIEFFENNAATVTTGDGHWMYFPYWIMKDGEDTVTLYDFDNLPPHVKELIESMRK